MARKPTGNPRGRPRINEARDAFVHRVVFWLLNDPTLAQKIIDQPGLDPGRNESLATVLAIVEETGDHSWWRAADLPVSLGKRLTTNAAGSFLDVYELAAMLLSREPTSRITETVIGGDRVIRRFAGALRVVDGEFWEEIESGFLQEAASRAGYPSSLIFLSRDRIAAIYDEEQKRLRLSVYECPQCGGMHCALDNLQPEGPCLGSLRREGAI